jgi:hypothetical protein
MLFGYIDDQMSDGAQLAIRRATEAVLKPDWLDMVQAETVRAEADAITRGTAALSKS